MKAVIMAAGYGTRFLPFTKAVSKTMLPIIDKPTIQIVVEEAIESGCDEILIIVGANKESIVKHFSKDDAILERLKNNPEMFEVAKNTYVPKIQFVEQKVLNGTGGAMLLAKDFVGNEPFLLMFADDLYTSTTTPVSKQLIDLHKQTGKTILACKHVPKQDIVKYCSVEYSEQNGRVYSATRIVEKPKFEEVKSTLSALGRYVLKPNIFKLCENLPEKKGEKIITDAYGILAEQGDVLAYDFDGIRYDIGNKFGYLTAVVDFALKDENYSEKLKEYLKNKI